MDEVRYMISDAARLVGVEAHVLRYWQRELGLPISRNEMDQRYYKESDIELFKKVKKLKEKGFQLKAIKMILSNLSSQDQVNNEADSNAEDASENKIDQLMHEDKLQDDNKETSLVADENKNELNAEPEDKLFRFKSIMNEIILSALRENNGILTDVICSNVTDNVMREMNYLMRLQEEKEEERFRKFDAALREYQKSRLMAAAAVEKKKKSKFMRKNRIYI